MRNSKKSLGILAGAVPVLLALSLPAGAARPMPSIGVATGANPAAAAAPETLPNSVITKGLKFSPNRLSVAYSSPTGPGDCGGTSEPFDFTVTNRSTASQTLFYGGTAIKTIPKGAFRGFCTYGSGKFTFVLTLGSSAATLHVTAN